MGIKPDFSEKELYEYIEKELERADDPDYVEKEAREQLKLIMPGEKLYFFPQSDDGDSDSNKDKDDD